MTHSHLPYMNTTDSQTFEQKTIRDLIDLERDRVRGKTEIAIRELQIEADDRAAVRANALAFKNAVTEGFSALAAALAPLAAGALKDITHTFEQFSLPALADDNDDDQDGEG